MSRMEFDRNTDGKRIRLLSVFVIAYCVVQPVLDVMGYWQQVLGLGNLLTTAIRSLLLAGAGVLGFLLSDRKRAYVLMAAVLAALTGLHIAANLPGGYQEPMTDIANLARLYLLPVSTLCFITCLKRGGRRVFRAMKIGLSADLAIILLVELVSVVTGTGRATYVKEQIGVIGWFVWGNCQSAILSMLTPLVICWTLERWRDRLLPVALVTLAAEAALYFFGARLTFASLVASGLGVGVCLLLIDRSRWRQALAILLITGMFACAYPVSPAARRLRSLAESNQRNERETQSLRESLPGEGSEPGREAQTEPESLEALYRHYFPAVIDRFGTERVAEKYGYTRDAAVLGDVRICKRVACELLMEEAPAASRFFGLNVSLFHIPAANAASEGESGATAEGKVSVEVENDFHGIYYVLGWTGLGLIVAFLLYFGLRALLCVLREPKKSFTLDMVGFAGAYVFALIHAYFTVSVLRRNNASVYLALVLAGLWYLSGRGPARRDLNRAPAERMMERRSHGA